MASSSLSERNPISQFVREKFLQDLKTIKNTPAKIAFICSIAYNAAKVTLALEGATNMKSLRLIIRYIVSILLVVILIGLTFWLINGRRQLFSAATQNVSSPTPAPLPSSTPTAKPISTSTATQLSVSSAPTSTATAAPTATPTVYYSDATVIVIVPTTTPVPSPTISPGYLAKYRLEDKKELTSNRPSQTFVNGWTSDEKYLFIFSLSNFDYSTSIVTLLPLGQSKNFNIDNLSVTTLNSTVSRNSNFISLPIKRHGYLDYFFYREDIENHQFNLWISNFDGNQQHLVAETNTPHFTISSDGYLMYLDQNQLHLIHPTLVQPQSSIIATIPLETAFVDVTDRFFDLSLSPNGQHIALYDGRGQFYIINTSSQQVTNLSLTDDMKVSQVVWAPDGLTIAYIIASNSDEPRLANSFPPYLVVQAVDGSNKQEVKYHHTSDGISVGIANPKWSPNDQLLIANARPYGYCEGDCRDVIILVSADGQYVTELEKMNFIWNVEWSASGNQIAYSCFDTSESPKICVSTVGQEELP